MTDLMTDFINRRKSLEERCSEKLQQFKKLYKKNHFDTNGIMTLTEIQCMHACYRLNKKIFAPFLPAFTAFCHRSKKSD